MKLGKFKQFIFGLIVGGLVFGCLCVSAVILIDSQNVTYKGDNVKNVLDNLISNIGSCNGSGSGSDNNEENTSSNVTIAAPVVSGNLIPVKLDDQGNATRVAENDPTWYDYGNKIWANAVELYEGAKYTENGENRDYTVGDKINPNDIRSYFVWIPKYRYKLWNVNSDGSDGGLGKHLIEIKFESDINDNTDSANDGECTTPISGTGDNKQGISNSTGICHNGDWMSHPAFLTMGVDGFWVAKFELGHKDNNKLVTDQSMSTSNVGNVVIKPNHYSWSKTTALNYFNSLKEYNTSMNSHMMKNTEWGAVAYLSHSKYGKGEEITINNNLDNTSYWYVLTGYASTENASQSSYPGKYGTSENLTQPWNTSVGYGASTTGNISGIYDMSGGKSEYMASYISGGTAPSGDAKYYDTYGASSNAQDYKYRILGDATGEMGPFEYYADVDGTSRYHNKWFSDESYFVYSYYPWFYRGGAASYGVLAGAFYFNNSMGGANKVVGARLVLSPSR